MLSLIRDNTDQGSQYTSLAYRAIVNESGAKFSMNGRGRALDNQVIERFWRTLKYGEIYLKEYQSVQEAKNSIRTSVEKYNRYTLFMGL